MITFSTRTFFGAFLTVWVPVWSHTVASPPDYRKVKKSKEGENRLEHVGEGGLCDFPDEIFSLPTHISSSPQLPHMHTPSSTVVCNLFLSQSTPSVFIQLTRHTVLSMGRSHPPIIILNQWPFQISMAHLGNICDTPMCHGIMVESGCSSQYF